MLTPWIGGNGSETRGAPASGQSLKKRLWDAVASACSLCWSGSGSSPGPHSPVAPLEELGRLGLGGVMSGGRHMMFEHVAEGSAAGVGLSLIHI